MIVICVMLFVVPQNDQPTLRRPSGAKANAPRLQKFIVVPPDTADDDFGRHFRFGECGQQLRCVADPFVSVFHEGNQMVQKWRIGFLLLRLLHINLSDVIPHTVVKAEDKILILNVSSCDQKRCSFLCTIGALHQKAGVQGTHETGRAAELIERIAAVLELSQMVDKDDGDAPLIRDAAFPR